MSDSLQPLDSDIDYEAGQESQSLLANHDHHSETDNRPHKAYHPCSCSCHTSSTAIAKWASILCILCTLLNLLYISGSRSTEYCHDKLKSITQDQLYKLKRPSPFIGFDKIEHDPDPSLSIINYPHFVAQIDAKETARVFPDDPARYMSNAGLVSPQKRQVLITNSVSTIVQFRAMDYGMNLCEMVLRVPPANSSRSSQFTISVHTLSSSGYLNPRTLSFDSRPEKLARLDNIQLKSHSGATWSRNFTCSWDELLTFEFSCFQSNRLAVGYGAPDDCSMSWWQDDLSDDPSQGVFMRQYSTVNRTDILK